MNKIITFGNVDEGARKQAENCLNEAVAIALMADNHKGYGMPVGGVAVYKDKISPAGVGFDIACGNKAVKLNLKYNDIKDNLNEFAKIIGETISFGIGKKTTFFVEESYINKIKTHFAWDDPFMNDDLKDKAISQLGTVGSGNHYVDVFKDEDDTIWIGVHFGSRGLGHTIASEFMKRAGDNVNIMDETPHTLDVFSEDGKQYLGLMDLAGVYAYTGRDLVCDTVTKILGGEIVEQIHNHHNFSWKETHNGEEYWVVRKGATPAFPNQKGFVGSSMGDDSVIIEGVDSELSKQAFYSTIHGAGRIMSRTEAAGKKKKVKTKRTRPDGTEDDFTEWQIISKGKIDFEQVKEDIKNNGTILVGGGADEAPGVYKKLPEVLEAHKGTIKVLHTLTPLIVVMAGAETFDPYKD